MKSFSTVDAVALRGVFRVRCEAEADRTVLREREVSAPFHLSKPYWTGDVLLIQAVNATAGVFAGDQMAMSVEVEPGARVLFTSPSASRIHTMPSGAASLRQDYRVSAGGWLEVRPELFIPQAGCRYRQQTRIGVESGGALFFAETLAPGRVARGECFAFDEVGWAMDLFYAGRRIVRERYTLRARDASAWALQHPFATGYYAGCYLVAENAAAGAEYQSKWNGLTDEARWIGASSLDPVCWSIKILAADSEVLRETLNQIRSDLAAAFPALAADARKL